jgi:hypothetical protein
VAIDPNESRISITKSMISRMRERACDRSENQTVVVGKSDLKEAAKLGGRTSGVRL